MPNKREVKKETVTASKSRGTLSKVQELASLSGTLNKEIEKSVNYTQGFLIFPRAFGTPNELFGRNTCAIHYAANLTHGQMPEYITDLEHCQYYDGLLNSRWINYIP